MERLRIDRCYKPSGKVVAVESLPASATAFAHAIMAPEKSLLLRSCLFSIYPLVFAIASSASVTWRRFELPRGPALRRRQSMC
jgi:hypothetical protein